jgi:MEDS: MEthanogen/methylotroph, DcmR Sensory domain
MAMAHLNRANAFWAEMSACEHFVQIYESEEVFMDTLVSFVSKALKEDHTAVVIATPAHRQELNERLMESGCSSIVFDNENRFLFVPTYPVTLIQ